MVASKGQFCLHDSITGTSKQEMGVTNRVRYNAPSQKNVRKEFITLVATSTPEV